MNPAISLTMWRFGVFPGAGVVPYTVAQLLGSVVGVLAARVVWGEVIAERPVVYAALQPGPLWTIAELFAAETVSMAVIVLIVGICLADDRVARFVPSRKPSRRATAMHVNGRQREPGPPVRAGRHVWRDALSVGISTRPDAGSRDRGMVTTDDPAPPRRVDPPTMRYPTGWTPALRCSALEATELLSATDRRSITGRHDHERSPI